MHFSYTDECGYLNLTDFCSHFSSIGLVKIIQYIGNDIDRANFLTKELPVLPLVFLFTNSMDIVGHLLGLAEEYDLYQCFTEFVVYCGVPEDDSIRSSAGSRAEAQKLITKVEHLFVKDG